LGKSGGRFTSNITPSISQLAGSIATAHIKSADFDGDGHADVVAVSTAPTAIFMYQKVSDTVVAPAPVLIFKGTDVPSVIEMREGIKCISWTNGYRSLWALLPILAR